MYISNELKILDKSEFKPEIRANFIDILYYVIDQIIEKKNLFELDNFEIKYYDEYTFETYCNKDIFNTIFIEINQPLNYKTSTKKSLNLKKNKEKISLPELYYTLDDFQEELIAGLINNLDNNNLIWKDEKTICVKSVINDDNENYSIFFKIIPCLTYYNKDNKKGQIYHRNGGTEINYIDLAIKNHRTKNKATKGLYKDTILIFKNILLKDKKINNLPSEIIETMLYNVPNTFFKDLSQKSMLAIINYIRNNSLKDFKTIDEQDYAFVSEYRSMSLLYVKHITKLIEKFFVGNQ